jgi:hypothetical protein
MTAEEHELRALLSDTAQLVDPPGENDIVSLLVGLLAWAVSHPSTFEREGWNRRTVQVAIRWNWPFQPEHAADMIAGLEPLSSLAPVPA